MTKTLPLVRHKNYNLSVDEGIVIHYFQVTSMFYWRFHLKDEIPINCLFT